MVKGDTALPILKNRCELHAERDNIAEIKVGRPGLTVFGIGLPDSGTVRLGVHFLVALTVFCVIRGMIRANDSSLVGDEPEFRLIPANLRGSAIAPSAVMALVAGISTTPAASRVKAALPLAAVEIHVDATSRAASADSWLESIPNQGANPQAAPNSTGQSSTGQGSTVEGSTAIQTDHPTDSRSVDKPDSQNSWVDWVHLCSAKCVKTNCSGDLIDVHAAASTEGAFLFISSRAAQKIPVRLLIRLPHGVYNVERVEARLSQSTGENSSNGSSEGSGPGAPPSADSTAAPVDLPSFSGLRVLEGADLTSTSLVIKNDALLPGQAKLYRFADVARAARMAHMALSDSLHNMERSTPGPEHHLRHILSEDSDCWGSLSRDGDGESTERRVHCIHRLLLFTAQAQAMHHNYQEHHIVNHIPGVCVMDSLNGLTNALSLASATMSGLASDAQMTPIEAHFTSAKASATESASVAASRFAERDVVVSLANRGSHTVDMVKIGIDTSALPVGTTCEPADPAFFGSVQPGQSIRATFRIRMDLVAGAESKESQISGDVSYFRYGVPAHLRPRVW